MARTLKSDKMLFLMTLLLVGFSVVMVFSASAVVAAERYQSAALFVSKQLVWAIIGIGLMLVVMRVEYHHLKRPALIWTLLALTVTLLFAVFLFDKVNGTRRWIQLGFASIQPSEIAKLALVVFIAAVLDRRMHRVNDASHTLLPIGAVAGGLVFLVFSQPDFGTAVMLAMIALAMLFAAGLSYRYLGGVLMLLLPAAMVAVYLAPYRMKRMLTFLDPMADELNGGYQITHSLIALGTGGLFGKGLMASVEKLFYIPEAHTDFIFAVIGEELGLLGTTLTLACFVIIGWRGLRASLRAPDRFGALLGVGITTMIVVQALINMSVVTSLAPTKGIPLPLISNGGSSLLINLVAMGILLNISQQTLPVTGARAREVSSDGSSSTDEGFDAVEARA